MLLGILCLGRLLLRRSNFVEVRAPPVTIVSWIQVKHWGGKRGGLGEVPIAVLPSRESEGRTLLGYEVVCIWRMDRGNL